VTLKETATAIASISDDPVVQQVSQTLLCWIDENTSATELEEGLERYIGNSWIKSDTDHAQMYSLWSAFRDSAIQGISGMTMNERLYWFDLTGRFDSCDNEEDRRVVYAKVHAAP
jgi:hypothetical protein